MCASCAPRSVMNLLPHGDSHSPLVPVSLNLSRQNLGMIQSRLEKLDKEKEELSEYYALDKERRCGTCASACCAWGFHRCQAALRADNQHVCRAGLFTMLC
jgi:hypothetical protein